MIYITGDCHKDFRRFFTKNFPEQKEMTKDDYVIICGDFAGVWSNPDSKHIDADIYDLDLLENRPFTTLFVDGNHENFDELYKYPVKEWNGGKVHELRPSVLHLMRGQIFEIEGKKIFSFGGASSHDIQGGILEPDDPEYTIKKKELDKGELPYRINHVTWWKQELPTEEEMEEGRKNLEAHGNTVDYIVTHCCATSTLPLIGGEKYKPDVLNNYFEELRQKVEFKKWFFGHYHDNLNVSDKEILIYEQIIRIS